MTRSRLVLFVSTLIVALAIPLCLLIAFMVLDFSGRTLNIISLAGLAFAFVVDAEVEALTLVNAAMGADKALIDSVRVFDEFEARSHAVPTITITS